MTLKQQAIRGIIWSLVQRWGSQAITFTVFLLLARLLEPRAFGLIALATVFVSFVQMFSDQGFRDAIVQRPDLEPEYLDTAFWVNIASGLFLAVISVAAAGHIATFFKEPALAPVIRWLSLTFVITAVSSVQGALLTRDLKFELLAVRQLVGIFVGGITGVTMALLGYGVWSLVVKQLIEALVSIFVLWNLSNWRPRINASRRHCKELLCYGASVVGLRTLNFLNHRSGDFLIGYFLGSVALGYYTIAYRIVSIVVDIMVSSIQQLAFPVFSRLQHDSAKLRHAFFEAIEFTTLAAFPIFIGLSVLAPEIIVVMFGQQWTPSIPAVQILALMGLVSSILYYNDPVIMAMGKPQWSLILSGLSAVLNLMFFGVAVHWGIVAVAAAFVLRGYLILPIMLWTVNQVLPFRWTEYFHKFMAQFIAGFVMASSVLGAKTLLNETFTAPVLLPCYIMLGAAIYSITISSIAPDLLRRLSRLVRHALPQPLPNTYVNSGTEINRF